MKRLHVHVGVDDLEQSIRFYAALFAAEPSVRHADYAKWQLEDPHLNFAISTRTGKQGLDHLGIQAESEDELNELEARLSSAGLPALAQNGTSCCYARSDKHWTVDPQGIAWESFRTLEQISVFGSEPASPRKAASACCAPESRVVQREAPAKACC